MLRSQLSRNINDNSDKLVAVTSAVKALYTAVFKLKYRSALSACGYVVFNLAVKSRNLKFAAESCRREAYMHLNPNIVAVTLEYRVRTYVYRDAKITCRAAVCALVALTARIYNLTVVNTRRNINGERCGLTNSSRAVTFFAGRVNNRTFSVTLRTGFLSLKTYRTEFSAKM